MIALDLTALSKIGPEHGLSFEEIQNEAGKIPKFLQRIHSKKQGFYRDAVLKNEKLLSEMETFAAQISGKFSTVVVLGIGGSALGTITLKEAFGNLFTGTKPQLFVLDNIDPVFLSECEQQLDLGKTLFLVVTKSGGTPETLAQYFYFSEKIKESGFQKKEHFVFVTDPQEGFLREEAERKKIPSFAAPPDVGGRFSVLTAVGLFPALLMGIDIRRLLEGAISMRAKFLSENFSENLPFQLATVQYLLYRKHKTINVMMPYSQKLLRFADWYRQLLAESIGKALNQIGAQVHVGITPVNALGVTDQHSQLQLYSEGPNDKLHIFLDVRDFGADLSIPLPSSEDKRFSFLKGLTFAELMHTERKATVDSLTHLNRPNLTIHLPKISEEHLGELFLLCEGATAFLGEYFGINAFDQPGVELSKKLTREYLSHS